MALQHLLIDRAELGRDLLRHISLIALDLRLLLGKLLRALLLLRLERPNASLERSIRILALQSIDCRLNRLPLCFQRRAEGLLAIAQSGDLALKSGACRLAGGAFAADPLKVDNSDNKIQFRVFRRCMGSPSMCEARINTPGFVSPGLSP